MFIHLYLAIFQEGLEVTCKAYTEQGNEINTQKNEERKIIWRPVLHRCAIALKWTMVLALMVVGNQRGKPSNSERPQRPFKKKYSFKCSPIFSRKILDKELYNWEKRKKQQQLKLP